MTISDKVRIIANNVRQVYISGLKNGSKGEINPIEQASPIITIESGGLITAEATQTEGYVLPGTKTATKQLETVEQATPTISVTSGGMITAEATQTEGYVVGGNKIATKQLDIVTQANPVITVGTDGKISVSATQSEGYILPQTKKASVELSSEHDADFEAENIRNGITIFGKTGIYKGELATTETFTSTIDGKSVVVEVTYFTDFNDVHKAFISSVSIPAISVAHNTTTVLQDTSITYNGPSVNANTVATAVTIDEFYDDEWDYTSRATYTGKLSLTLDSSGLTITQAVNINAEESYRPENPAVTMNYEAVTYALVSASNTDTIFAPQTLSFTQTSLQYSDFSRYINESITITGLEAGKSYKIVWDGTEYIRTCVNGYSYNSMTFNGLFLGNPAEYAGEYIGTDTGEPFCIRVGNGSTGVYTTNTSATHTVAIYRV